MYYNTTNESGDRLRTSHKKATRQEDVILAIFERRGELSPSQVENICRGNGHDWPITSIRRAISDLTAKGKLVKTEKRKEGKYRKCEYIWGVA